MQSLWAVFTHRSAINNAPGILFSAGCYFPKDRDDWSDLDPEIITSCSRISDMVNWEIIDEMKNLQITDEEFSILKVLFFFTAGMQIFFSWHSQWDPRHNFLCGTFPLFHSLTNYLINYLTILVPQLSRKGYEIVQGARRKYSNTLTELIRTQNANKPFTEIIDRINRFMLLLPIIEVS